MEASVLGYHGAFDQDMGQHLPRVHWIIMSKGPRLLLLPIGLWKWKGEMDAIWSTSHKLPSPSPFNVFSYSFPSDLHLPVHCWYLFLGNRVQALQAWVLIVPQVGVIMKRLSLAGPLCAHVPCLATLCSAKTEYADNNQENFILLLFHHLE